MKDFLILVLKCFYLMLPAYFANMAPVFVKKLAIFNYPLDFNKTFLGKPILGKNKTFRGIISGTLFGILVAFLQSYAYNLDFFRGISFIDYKGWLVFGALMGFGAILGDSIKSFFKRRIGIESGAPFIPFDQMDFTAGALIAVSVFGFLTLKIIFVSLFINFFLHIIVNHIAHFLKIRDTKW